MGDLGSPLGQEDPLKKQMATHSSILALRIPWTEEPSRLQSMDSQRVGHDLVTEQTKRGVGLQIKASTYTKVFYFILKI